MKNNHLTGYRRAYSKEVCLFSEKKGYAWVGGGVDGHDPYVFVDYKGPVGDHRNSDFSDFSVIPVFG